MGILTYIAKEVAKDVALDATIGVAGAIGSTIEKASEKKEKHTKEKLMKGRKKNNHLLISFSSNEESFLGKIKARKYIVEDELGIRFVVRESLKQDSLGLVEIRDSSDKSTIASFREVQGRIDTKQFDVFEYENFVGNILVTMDGTLCKYTLETGESWQVVRKNDKEFKIVHLGKEVGHCKVDNLKLKKSAVMMDYVEGENASSALYLGVAILLSRK